MEPGEARLTTALVGLRTNCSQAVSPAKRISKARSKESCYCVASRYGVVVTSLRRLPNSCSKEMRLVVTRDQGSFSSRAILVFGETVRKAGHKLRYWQLLPPNSCHLSYQRCLWG